MTQHGPWRWYAGEVMNGFYSLACAGTREAVIEAAAAKLEPGDRFHIVEARFDAADEARAVDGRVQDRPFAEMRSGEWIG